MASKKKLSGWGARIFSARAEMLGKRGRKMTQQELADAVGVSAQQIGFYESETNWPGYEAWVALAKALRMTPGTLLFGKLHVPIEEGVDVPLEGPKGKKRA